MEPPIHSGYSLVGSSYYNFHFLESQMPADPVRELELSIKKEREDEIAAQIKSEPRFDIPEKKRRNPNQTFKCRICPAEFKSKYAFTVHFNKEMILKIPYFGIV